MISISSRIFDRGFCRAALLAVLPLATFGCAGGGDGRGPSTGATLGGTINTTSYVLPAGTNVNVASNLTINASDSIEIDGSMTVSPGVTLTLVCPNKLTVKGSVKSAPSAAGALKSAGVAAPRGVLGDVYDWSAGGISVELGASVTGDTIYMSSQPHGLAGALLPSTIDIAGIVKCNAGSLGNPGTNGGSVEIGTPAAIAAAGGSLTRMPDHVTIEGTVWGGNGGDGVDAVPAFSGLDVSGVAGNAGNGGSVKIDASADIAITGDVKGGDGGVGGKCVLVAKNGISSRQKGGSVTATNGSGGNGGNVTLTSPKSTGKTQGGNSGYSRDLDTTAGIGGPAGAGGDTTWNIAAVGSPGTGTLSGTQYLGGSMLMFGGSGGASTDALSNGGSAGRILLRPSKLASLDKVYLSEYAGGNGFNGCPTGQRGTNGGNGGTITTGGVAYTLLPGAFNGGNGGNGTPFGSGGGNGFDLTKNVAIGVNGQPGNPCPVSANACQGPKVAWCDTSTNNVYVAGAKSNNVAILTPVAAPLARPSTLKPRVWTGTWTVSSTVPVGSQPFGVAGNGANTLFVANSDATMSIIDIKQGKVVATVPIGRGTQGSVAYNPVNNHVYVTNNLDGTVTVIDGTTFAVLKTISVGPSPFGVQFMSGLNHIYVSSADGKGGGQVSVINGGSDTVSATVPIAAPGLGLDTNEHLGYVYVVAGKTVVVIDGQFNKVIATSTIAAGTQPTYLASNWLLNEVFVADYAGAQVYVMNASNYSLIKTLPTGNNPSHLGLFFTIGVVFVPNYTDNTLTMIDGSGVLLGTMKLAP